MTRRESVPGGRQYRRVVRVSPEEDARLLGLVGGDQSKIAGLLIDAALYRNTATRSEVRECQAALFAVRHELARSVVDGVGMPREEARSLAERIDAALDRLASR
jgi:hypothetical protein